MRTRIQEGATGGGGLKRCLVSLVKKNSGLGWAQVRWNQGRGRIGLEGEGKEGVIAKGMGVMEKWHTQGSRSS
jgi:hypothetical protein